MSELYLLGIDIGTSSIKVLLTDKGGRRLGQHNCTNQIIQDKPGFVEQEAESGWWAGVRAGIRACLEQTNIPPGKIAGICASGMVPSLCPLDSDGVPIRRAILYRDNRSILQANRLIERFNWSFTLQDVVPKLLWLKENEPENYNRIATVLNAHSYIAYKLTGNYSADIDIASIFGEVYDDKANRWMTERMVAMGLNPDVLPPLYRPTDVVGTVTAAASRETGLAPGTPVVAGTGDSYTILAGTGTVSANEGLIYLGTAATFLGLARSLDDARGTNPFQTQDARFLANVLTGGEVTRWYRESLTHTPLVYSELEAMAATLPAGSEGLYALPHMLGERTPRRDPLAKGVFFGLTNAHNAGHVYRALLEGVAYALRESYQHAYLPLNRVVIGGGGGGKSPLWRQIIADVLNRQLEYISGADNALGTAYLAGLSLGVFDSFDTIKEEWLEKKQLITPDPVAASRYESTFEFYKELNAAMRPLYARHARFEFAGE